MFTVPPEIVIDMVIGQRTLHIEGSGDDGKESINDAINWLIEQFRLRYGLYGFKFGNSSSIRL